MLVKHQTMHSGRHAVQLRQLRQLRLVLHDACGAHMHDSLPSKSIMPTCCAARNLKHGRRGMTFKECSARAAVQDNKGAVKQGCVLATQSWAGSLPEAAAGCQYHSPPGWTGSKQLTGTLPDLLVCMHLASLVHLACMESLPRVSRVVQSTG